MLSPKHPQLDERDIDGVIETVQRILRRGTSLETAVRGALIVQFGSQAQFAAFIGGIEPRRLPVGLA